MHSPLDRISRSLSLLRPLSLLAMLVVLCSLPSRAADVFVDCTGGTPGAFTTLQSAIDSLDFVGPHSITMIAGPCIENVLILDRQRITFQRQTTGFGVAVISPDPGANAVRVFDSTGIVFIEVGFDDSFNGLVVDRNSEVQAFGCTISGNSNAGLIVRGNSTVLVSSALIQSNAGIGINVVAGGSLSMDSDVLIANNGTGVNVVNGSNVRIFAPVSISNNTIGMTAGEASNIRLFGDPAGPTPVSVNGNTSIGVNTFGGHVTMFGPVQVRNNGAGGGSFHAGVRSDDNALVVVAGSGDVDISNNTGPGIEATNGGTLDLAGATIHNNTEDGVRLLGNSQIAVYPPNTNAIGNNRGHAILCDNTSNFFGDCTGLRDLLCQISQLKGRSARSWMGTGLQDEKPAPYIRAGKH